MPSKSTKSHSSGSSCRRKVNSPPNLKAKPLAVSHPAQPYLVIDTTLPSHIVTDRFLFTTYTAGRRVYRTAFGHNIIIEGIGDVDIRVFVSGQCICFCMRNCWHVPSSAHHFLSCATVTSHGHQVMLAGRSPRMIYSHKCRLVNPQLPKYIPFQQVDGLIVLNFDIIPAQPASTTSEPHSPAQPIVSLQASTLHPFAGLATLAFKQNSMAAANVCGHSDDIVSDTCLNDTLHGGADVLPVDVTRSFLLTVDVNAASYGGAPDVQMTMPLDGLVHVHQSSLIPRYCANVTPGPSHILDPSHLDYRDKLGNTLTRPAFNLPVVVDVVNGGAASAVAGIVVVDDGGAAHDIMDVVQVIDEPDGVAVEDCAPANVDVATVFLDTVDGEGNQRRTKIIIPDPSTLISLTDPNPNSNPLLSFHIPSSSYGFRAAFLNASDSDEKLEVAWTKDTYDLSENNGSLRDSHIN